MIEKRLLAIGYQLLENHNLSAILGWAWVNLGWNWVKHGG